MSLMAAAGKTIDWTDRASDWFNPILVKETRQALKSRQFIATFILMLAGAWLVTAFGLLLGGDSLAYGQAGGQLFSAFYLVLAFAIFVVVPFTTFRSLLAERDQFTFEVLSISALRPSQIVWGKLTSALVQLFIYYSAITPFLAFTSLLPGIDVITIAFTLVVSMLASLGLSLIALVLSTVARQRSVQVLVTLVVLGGLFSALSSITTMIWFGISEGMPFDEPEFWIAMGILFVYFVGYCLLLHYTAVAQLTFEADNRSTAIRLTLAALYVVTMAWAVFILLPPPTLSGWTLYAAPSGVKEAFFHTLSVFTVLHVCGFGLFHGTEPDLLSRRVRRGLPKWALLRVAFAPFLPGGTRGLLLSYLFLGGLLALASAGLCGFLVDIEFDAAAMVVTLVNYSVFYLGIAALLARWGRVLSGDFRPAHARVITLLIFAFASVIPVFVVAFERPGFTTPPLWMVTCPFVALFDIANGKHGSFTNVLVVGAAACVVVLVNIPSLFDSVRDVVRSAPPAPAPTHAHAHAQSPSSQPASPAPHDPAPIAIVESAPVLTSASTAEVVPSSGSSSAPEAVLS